MRTPRRGSETGHYMHMTRFRSGLYPIRQETTIYKRCQVCNNRRKLSKHPLGLKVCPSCTKAINEMLLSQRDRTVTCFTQVEPSNWQILRVRMG